MSFILWLLKWIFIGGFIATICDYIKEIKEIPYYFKHGHFPGEKPKDK